MTYYSVDTFLDPEPRNPTPRNTSQPILAVYPWRFPPKAQELSWPYVNTLRQGDLLCHPHFIFR